ncbi:MAG: hypothetical protein AB1391_01815 [Candidatus Micrarchaeota archaeon]
MSDTFRHPDPHKNTTSQRITTLKKCIATLNKGLESLRQELDGAKDKIDALEKENALLRNQLNFRNYNKN